ncbi:MAG: hypothetical protein KGL62_14795 [Bradyrhizobium sp.]|uniref:hypothetical protein n=1 Tax=Bradyrhizobium sp. TaxID=376 RepID=UPI00238DBAE6|nr:hypothetical protein [Bradyrhizobium sp.]MDE2603619.1 hypothetical protein [Bradyrhizobium sp.]
MKPFTAWVMSAGLVLTAAAADAQMLAPNRGGVSPYSTVADVDGPYAAMPREEPAPGYGPRLLPAPEVYTVVRENGFSPLGVPRLHGVFYTIAVLGHGGDDGRLVIDARDGQIVRFVPGWRRTGGNFNADVAVAYGSPGLPPVSMVRGPPRPPALIPHVASRTSVPLPRAMPQRPGESPVGAKAAESAPQSMAMEAKPLVAAPSSPAPAVEAKPAPPIQPTREMPKVQDLE